ncbi:uncharacterized protein GGS22DRAFT_174490 [Annulohypoxylon maeteangense]|uniref:uncharacterized protein n=1 Tax=Annulohypoxylon maeteangense TaxID=1927788 RepID=UPI0020085F8D|nr:uncharacterized protein GGS22DRAFT_174490 [Annulohypoxylon maeteangense]KAI0880673.1 hypothetical protein GGS22DRAFT_174490 [Annulohypoxylon maeteangense]
MKSNTIAAALFTASAVSGAVMKPRQANSFSVSNFTASCIPHSLLCTYEFAVITDPTTASPSGNPSPAQCSLMLQGPDYLPPVQLTGCADAGAYSWAVDVLKEGGLTLSVTTPQDSHTNFTGSYAVPAEQLVAEQHGAVITQRYTGPSAFAVPIGGGAA